MVLQLTEKEINFLILFSQNDQPLSRNFILKMFGIILQKLTLILLKLISIDLEKIFRKFKDSNFIKNNDKGYYI